jgi:Ribbon-helix-helix protein, copG family
VSYEDDGGMARMVRKQIYIRPDQHRRLKQLAKALGLSEAELIRRSLDQAVAPAATMYRDPAAWEAERRFVRARQAKGRLRGARNWKREDLYDRPVLHRLERPGLPARSPRTRKGPARD